MPSSRRSSCATCFPTSACRADTSRRAIRPLGNARLGFDEIACERRFATVAFLNGPQRVDPRIAVFPIHRSDETCPLRLPGVIRRAGRCDDDTCICSAMATRNRQAEGAAPRRRGSACPWIVVHGYKRGCPGPRSPRAKALWAACATPYRVWGSRHQGSRLRRALPMCVIR